MSNLISVAIQNKTNLLGDDEVFLTLIGTDEAGQQCFGKIVDGLVTWVSVDPVYPLGRYNYKLSNIAASLKIMPIKAARLYFSLRYCLNWCLDTSKSPYCIIEPDGFNPRDTNYYILYDKIEFTFNGNKAWINPTAVDFFSLPLQIAIDSGKQAGFTLPRQTIFNNINTILDEALRTQSPDIATSWASLFLSFVPQNKNGENCLLRMMSPAKAMQYVPKQSIFSRAYCDSFIDFLWSYYAQQGNKVAIDCTVLANDANFNPKLNDYIFVGTVIGNNFIFTNSNREQTVTISKISTFSLFTGTQGSLEFPNHTIGAIIAQTLAAAFTVGALPADNAAILNKDYFAKMKANNLYYTPNHLAPQGIWYDLYSKMLHKAQTDVDFYSFAYDDLLSQDGTLVIDSNNQISVTIGDMSNTNIPNPYADPNLYSVVINVGEALDERFYEVQINDRIILPDHAYMAYNVSSPLTLYIEKEKVIIYLNPTIILPADNDIAANIVVELRPGNVAAINIPAPPTKSFWNTLCGFVKNWFN